MSYLLDTNICISLLRGDDMDLVKKIQLRPPHDFFLCSIVKAELLFGARKSQQVEKNLSLLRAFFDQFESLPFDDIASEFYGILRNVLERDGSPIGANDLLIASIAQANEVVLITRNRKEFSRVPNLRLESW